MKRYQKLILDKIDVLYGQAEAVRIETLGDRYKPDTKNRGYAELSRELGAPTSSIHEWATFPNKVPTYKSLEKIAAYFNVPLPTLLMDVESTPDDQIIEALMRLDEDQKWQLVELIKTVEK